MPKTTGPSTSERFRGFGAGAVGLLEQLAANNERPWFKAHQGDYERECKGPMEALVRELEPKYGPSKVFRIHRDVRFSNDKSPYKTWLAASVGPFYISLSPDALWLGGGAYGLDGPGLARYRAAVDDDRAGRKLTGIVSKLTAEGYEIGSHETLRTAPRGFTAEHPRIDLLRRKGVYAGKGFDPDAAWVSTRQAFARITKVLDGVRPLNAWVAEHIGV